MYIPLGKVDLYLDVSLETKMVVNLAKLIKDYEKRKQLKM